MDPSLLYRSPNALPADTVAARLADEVDDRTACVLVSSVYYETAEMVPWLDAVAESCDRHGAALLVDAYHHLNVVPFDLLALKLQTAFVTRAWARRCARAGRAGGAGRG
jgi:kynureninase